MPNSFEPKDDCVIEGEGVLVRCSIGLGRAILVADAAVFQVLGEGTGRSIDSEEGPQSDSDAHGADFGDLRVAENALARLFGEIAG